MKTIEYVINPIFLEEVHSDLIKIDVKQAFVMGQDLFLKKKKRELDSILLKETEIYYLGRELGFSKKGVHFTYTVELDEMIRETLGYSR